MLISNIKFFQICMLIGSSDDKKRIFRLFNLSFHHFDDESAIKLLKNTMETSDGVAIIELQDRRLGCLAMMFFNFFFVLTITPFWQDTSSCWWKYNPVSLLHNAVCNSHIFRLQLKAR
jgi:hypothetical protein